MKNHKLKQAMYEDIAAFISRCGLESAVWQPMINRLVIRMRALESDVDSQVELGRLKPFESDSQFIVGATQLVFRWRQRLSPHSDYDWVTEFDDALKVA